LNAGSGVLIPICKQRDICDLGDQATMMPALYCSYSLVIFETSDWYCETMDHNTSYLSWRDIDTETTQTHLGWQSISCGGGSVQFGAGAVVSNPTF
jgi:hypothetical protein